ncbi:hypothetical protein BKA62DRAFT_705615 [Auriculariales sp. MPI-PUGE-AT-0066]|nr:hypothetical protein BKA62DRAFT_705615 [Auriculariales sp. MPI-PUGE-AT-0066]
MQFKFFAIAALLTATASAAPTLKRRQDASSVPSTAFLQVVTSGGETHVVLDSGRVFIEPVQDPNGPPIPPIEVRPGRFSVSVVSGAGSDALIQLSSTEGACRFSLSSGSLVCMSENDTTTTPTTGEGEGETAGRVPAPAVFRAKKSEDGSKWALLGGFKSWSIDATGGAGACELSRKPDYDIQAELFLSELVDIEGTSA